MPITNIENVKKACRVVVKFKDGNHANLDADSIILVDGVIQVWKGEQILVGIFNAIEIIGIYMSEKKEG